ncbi:MAG: PTS sugar transporter subunit IIB [Defluviitaleaceae bacterium]|nr:PTS sugar transporter subunit IIB [Defluviitaleaceae bacterium]
MVKFNIVLCCAMGMSASMLCNRIREAAKLEGIEVKIDAHPLTSIEQAGTTADIILLGPQVRHQKDVVMAKCPGKPVESVEMAAYGMMDGKKVIDQVRKVLGR